jgi:hypothetical protein
MAKKAKQPKDINQLAKSIVEQATEEEETLTQEEISKVMSILGRKGGKKGGIARKEALSEERRKEIAQKAAAARWGKKE